MNQRFTRLAAALNVCLGSAATAVPQQSRFQPTPPPAPGRSSLPARTVAPAELLAALRKLTSTPVKPETNLVISSHGNPFYAIAGAPYLAEGEAAVIWRLGKDFEIIARVKHDGWRAMTP